MKKSTIALIVIFLVTLSATYAQPQISLWRAGDNHVTLPDPNPDHNHEDAVQYECGTNYYLFHSEEDLDFQISIRNDGDANLSLQLPIVLGSSSTSTFEIKSQPSKSELSPGEEVIFTIAYLSPPSYLEDQQCDFVIMSNDPVISGCGMNILVGDIGSLISYCVCNEGELITRDLDVGEETVGRPFFVAQDDLLLHDGPCDFVNDECPDESELICYYSSRMRRGGNLATMECILPTDPYNLVGIPLFEGYCPCDFDYLICLDTYESIPDFPLLPPAMCPGEDVTIYLSDCMEEPLDSPTAAAESHHVEWCVDGFGEIQSGATNTRVIIQGWFPGDEVIAKVYETDDEDACLAVGSYYFNSYGPVESGVIYADEDEYCFNGQFTICYEEGIPVFDNARNQSVSRNGGVEWLTDGDGVFIVGTESGDEGIHCIEVDGLEPGDQIIAINHNVPTQNGCIAYASYEIGEEESGDFCYIETAENKDIDGFDIDDPCNCSDPLNIGTGSSLTYFHDVLTITGDDINMGETVTLSNLVGFFDMNGDALIGPIMVPITTDGIVQYDFWHVPDVGATADVTVGTVTESFVSSMCSICEDIPTIGQWGAMSLALMLFIFGIVGIRQKVLSVKMK